MTPNPVATGSLHRGERLANPGNLEHGQPWQGLSPDQPDPRFCKFIDDLHGVRALALVLLNAQRLHGRKTIGAIISKYAPPIDSKGHFQNDTSAYEEDVAKRLGVGVDDQIDLESAALLASMCRAVIQHEQGRVLCRDVIPEAVRLALA